MLNKEFVGLYSAYSVCIARLLITIAPIRFQRIIQKLPFSKLPLILTQFLKEHKKDIIYLGGVRFKIPELNEDFSTIGDNFLGFKSALDAYFKMRKTISFKKEKNKIYAEIGDLKFRIPFPYGILELSETFYDECYGTFKVKDWTIVDIGAFIGDTAIYFANKGAKKVIAFEPAPHCMK